MLKSCHIIQWAILVVGLLSWVCCTTNSIKTDGGELPDGTESDGSDFADQDADCTAWYGLGNSQAASHCKRVGAGSASGGGVSGFLRPAIYPSVAVSQNGLPIVAWCGFADADTSDIYLLRWNGTDWEELAGSGTEGGVSNRHGSSYYPSLALDADDNPVLAWHAGFAGRADIFLRRWNGDQWQELGGSGSQFGISNTNRESRDPSLSLDSNGHPVVAWTESLADSENVEIYLRRWNGTTWEEVEQSASGNGISNNPGVSWYPSVIVDDNDQPVVAWYDYTPSDPEVCSEIYLRRFNGNTWEELGSSATLGGVSDRYAMAQHPSVALEQNGQPVVVWHDYIFRGASIKEIYLRRFNGADWEGVGNSTEGIAHSPNNSEYPSLALGQNDYPVVAWQDSYGLDAGLDIFLLQWNGSTWEGIGGSDEPGGISNNSGNSKNASLALNSIGYPTVAWDDRTSGQTQIYLRQWNGWKWVELGGETLDGGISNNRGMSDYPSLAMNQDGKAVVAWKDESFGGRQIYVRVWNGQSWEELDGSGSGRGISKSEGWATWPSAALDMNGNPFVAWMDHDFATDKFEIYLRTWDGNAWRELGGSGSGAGLSNKARYATYPVVKVGINGLPGAHASIKAFLER